LAGIRNENYILIAEDNEADVYLAKLALRDHGFNDEVRVLVDGEEAFRFVDMLEAESGAPDVILMLLDLHLPKRDGLEVLRRLRAGRKGSRIPVLILTSSDSPYERAAVEGFEKVHFLRKPSSLEEYLVLGAIAKDMIGGREKNARVASVGTISINP
jgi:CheY-like chemotaxis protein